MKAYSQDLRDRVIKQYEQGNRSKAKLAQLFQLGTSTVDRWIKRYKSTGECRSFQGLGCGRKTRFDDKQAILSYLSENEDANAIEMRDDLFPGCTMSTWYDTLARMGITYKKKSQSISNDQKNNEQAFWMSWGKRP